MSETLVWWLMAQVVALACLPLCLTLFRRLPDRGYSFAKPFALIILGYLFWILNVMRVLPNSSGGIWVVLLLLIAASGLLAWRRRDELLAFARERWWLIATVEVLFFISFITAAYLRSYVPEVAGTEKPMDLMFLNVVTRGDSFPPPDAWLSGENVSYYYFGYLLVSIMTRLSGLATSIGFNLGLAMTVALAVTGAFGLVYNMAAPREEAAATRSHPLWRPMAFGLAAGLFITVMGSLEGLLELLAAHDVGPQRFWEWVGIRDSGSGQLALNAYNSSHWYPDQHWFWWRATRMLDGGVGIHEMPFFSFLLGDLHPHVMSIPFVLLAAAVALALLRSDEPLDLVVWLERPFWLPAMGVILGALAFLNTWDMPTLAFVIGLLALIRNRLLADRWSWGLALDTFGFLAPLYLVAFLAYTPFLFGGFTSQAAGFTAEAGNGSGLFHTFLIWGPFAAIVLPYAAWRVAANGERLTWRAAAWALAPVAAIIALWVVWDLFGANRDPADANRIVKGVGPDALLGWLPNAVLPNDGSQPLFERIADRGWNWLTVIALSGALGLLVLALAREVEAAKRTAEDRLGHIFTLAIATTAALLVLGSEFVYIEDTFGSRMNTIFKLYYQSWLLLSVASGFALYELARGWSMPRVALPETPGVSFSLGGWSLGEVGVVIATFAGAIIGIVLTPDLLTRLVGAVVGGGILFVLSGLSLAVWRATEQPREEAPGGALTWRGVWTGGLAVVLLAAFVYPVLATYNRTNDFKLPRSLDGLDYIKRGNPGEYDAIRWLADREGQPVIAEALGGDYSDGGRVSAATGLPTLIQWPGHQLQWRGTSAPQAGREQDLEQLYTSTDPEAVRTVIQRYNISYVFVGTNERQMYPNLSVPEMADLFEPAFEGGDTVVYRVRPGARERYESSR